MDGWYKNNSKMILRVSLKLKMESIRPTLIYVSPNKLKDIKDCFYELWWDFS